MSFKEFCNQFEVNTYNEEENKSNAILKLEPDLERQFNRSSGAIEFLEKYAGKTFNEGLYRIHSVDQVSKWNDIVSYAFPKFTGHFLCFSYDWLGRNFALDLNRMENNEPLILMFEPGTGEAFEIDATFKSFHNEQLIEYQDAALAVNFFKEWKQETNCILVPKQCVGYRVPLFLGGEDSMANLDLSDMEVYWDICGQLINKMQKVQLGTKIEKITLT